MDPKTEESVDRWKDYKENPRPESPIALRHGDGNKSFNSVFEK